MHGNFKEKYKKSIFQISKIVKIFLNVWEFLFWFDNTQKNTRANFWK